LDTKDLIIVAGSIFFTLIVAHGLWTARRSRMNDIRMDIHAKTDNSEGSVEAPSVELPNGGARVISQALQTAPATSGNSSAGDHPIDEGKHPIWQESAAPYGSATRPDTAPLTEDLFPSTEPEVREKPESKAALETISTSRSGSSQEPVPAKEPRSTGGRPKEPKLEDLLILGVMAKSGSSFGGVELIGALRAQGLKFGDMGIFHREESGTAERLYSVANAVEPGTFDLSDLEALQTLGLTFFMQLPVPGDALEALDEMILSARTVAATLGGDVKDDTMSALTGQTVEHMKQRIADFARKQLTNANNK
jgi:cell division protein ZipA